MEKNSQLLTPTVRDPSQEARQWDSRYRSIIDRLNRMLEQLRRQPSCDVSGELDQLVTATLTHIGPEESFMELVAFPKAREHRLCHQSISIGTAKLRYRLAMGKGTPADELEQIRRLWLEHIDVHDRAFEAFLTARG
ncbi:hypothetical protein KOM00_07520 [Geomonas sp. Red69]|uniref:Hemerythrin-like domain-containing protein n=1 Tax=Geomonas diazotrophica TaxID=2843197 RepID=A0ABX8JML9_9BACT|nr:MULTISPECIES: hypothetical protein [Geomonas]MBU5636584.1 hypothetical protein [Geomonas diazotrophica]QWV98617.1 hypothetical protein KP005_04830 [Geomonas nitrogeniifigens]QXE87793.1 hypothetical protein KP003_05150 [Geomonas nitrogeniifigens]